MICLILLPRAGVTIWTDAHWLPTWEKQVLFLLALDTVAASRNQHPQIPSLKGWDHGHPQARCHRALLMVCARHLSIP